MEEDVDVHGGLLCGTTKN